MLLVIICGLKSDQITNLISPYMVVHLPNMEMPLITY